MKRILLATTLLFGFALTACAPLVSTAISAGSAIQNDPATLTTDGTSVVFTNAAPTTAQDAVVVLYGPVTVSGAACAPFSKSWVCPIGDVVTGQAFPLAYTGILNDASASFYRAASGNRPIYTPLK